MTALPASGALSFFCVSAYNTVSGIWQRRKSEAMKKTLITMTSITYAMKAGELCRKNGIRCDVVRTPKNIGSGCGYSLSVKGGAEKVLALLDKNSIPYKQSFEI